jgi:hypothetical protein
LKLKTVLEFGSVLDDVVGRKALDKSDLIKQFSELLKLFFYR